MTPLNENTVSMKAFSANPESDGPGTSAPENGVQTLPLLPLRNTVLFPHLFVPLSVGRPSSLAAVEAVLATEEKAFIVAAQRDTEHDQPAFADLYPVGTRAVVKKMARNDQGVIEMIVQGVERVQLLGVEQVEPYLKVQYRSLPLPEDGGPELEALQRAIIDLAVKVLELAEAPTPIPVQQLLAQSQDPLRFAFLLGSMLSLDVAKEQALLEAAHAPSGADAAARLSESRGAGAASCGGRSPARSRRRCPSSSASTCCGSRCRPFSKNWARRARRRPRWKSCAAGWRRPTCLAEVRKEAERELTRLERLPAGRSGSSGDPQPIWS